MSYHLSESINFPVFPVSQKCGLVSLLVMTGLLGGCFQKNQPSQRAPSDMQRVENEPAFRFGRFLVLDEPSDDATLPYVAKEDGSRSEEPCFAPQKKLRPWKTANTDIFKMIADNRDEIHESISNWVLESFEHLAGDALAQGFEVTLKDPMIVHAPPQRTALVPDQSCVDIVEQKAVTPKGVITTLFGSKTIEIRTKMPISSATVKAMRAHAKKLGFRLQASPAKYPRAKGADGRPKKDLKGRPLFQAPDGNQILRMNIPKPKNRPILDWRLRFKSPLFYAAGDLPRGVWASETSPTLCEVFLVSQDTTPRMLECGRLKNAGFGVAPGDTPSEVLVKITVKDEVTSKSIPYDTRTAIVAAGRVVVWVTAQKVEEGAKLITDSVVLFPDDPDPADVEATEATPEEPEKKDKKKKKRSKKKTDSKATEKPKQPKESKPKESSTPPPPIY